MGVEPTIRSAKDRIDGFEGREDHRTLFASKFRNLSHWGVSLTLNLEISAGNTYALSVPNSHAYSEPLANAGVLRTLTQTAGGAGKG